MTREPWRWMLALWLLLVLLARSYTWARTAAVILGLLLIFVTWLDVHREVGGVLDRERMRRRWDDD